MESDKDLQSAQGGNPVTFLAAGLEAGMYLNLARTSNKESKQLQESIAELTPDPGKPARKLSADFDERHNEKLERIARVQIRTED